MGRILTNQMMRQQLHLVKNMTRIEKESDELKKLLFPEFINWDGCILLANLNNVSDLGTHFESNECYTDRTGYEAFCNHIHLVDYCPEFEEFPLQSLIIALKILSEWKIKLKREFPSMVFHIILSYDEYGSVLRFYQYRIEEGAWVNIDNIEGYTEQGLMIVVV